MTRENIIKLAQEAGWDMDDTVDGFSVRLERFAALVAAAENEACAKLVEDWDNDSADPRDIAASIRARGTT